ncbi:type VII secretion target [Nocardia sp. NRRL WC-3656]|uniref:type VII secretion target n=1 Tax=Nocardia sp. NRRL WC-3656 TaxID=1463824 RepID=UPI00068BDC1B|nr:type VII secretion target [Nocardia sp. NRRL WC-3656]
MSSGQVHVDPDKIRTHAKNVQGVSDSLNVALQAVQAVSVPTDAFGKLCSFLPPLFVDTVEDGGLQAIKTAADALNADAGTLGQVATSLQSTDSANASELASVKPEATW